MQPASRPDVDAIFGIPPTVAIEQRTSRGGAQEHGGDADRDPPFPAPAVRQARHAALPRRATCRSSRRAPTRIVARLHARRSAASTSALLAPLVINRKGFYTDLAKWALAKAATRTCASTANSCRPRAGRASTASASTPSSCRSATSRSKPANETQLRAAAGSARSSSARACCTCSLRRLAAIATCRSTRSSARARSCGRSFPELDPRLFSYNSQARLVRSTATAPGVQIDEAMDRRATRAPAPRTASGFLGRVARAGRGRAPSCEGTAAEPGALACASAGSRSPTWRRMPVDDGAHVLREAGGCAGRERGDRARPPRRDHAARLGFLERGRAGLPRRSTARAPTLSGGEAQRIRLAAQLGSNLQRRLLHARRADHRPASARQPDPARHARAPRRQGQHAGGGRARRGHHPPRRARHRPRARAPGARGGHIVGAGDALELQRRTPSR